MSPPTDGRSGEESVDLQAVADRLEIQEQLAGYARRLDTKAWELWRSVFTEDADVEYSWYSEASMPRRWPAS